MGLIKEPLDIDFVVDSRSLTAEEKETISKFIRADKEKRIKKGVQMKRKGKPAQPA